MACWQETDILFEADDIVDIRIIAPPFIPAPLHPPSLSAWQHRATTGSTVPGAVWLSWRIPVLNPDPLEQIRIEKEQGMHYEYRVLRDGNMEWKTVLLEDTRLGSIDEVLFLSFGIWLYQRRKYLVTGLDRDGEYSFCIRAVNATGVSDETCNPESITPVNVQNGELPRTVALLQNYPNPFNPATTLTYTLDRAGPVELSVYDLTGRVVSSLVDGVQPAGYHEVRFNADGLPTGTYVYRLRAGTETLTRIMTLVR